MDLARELAVCQLHGREGGIGPVLASLGEDGGVEEVVVAEVGVRTTTLFISIVSASMEMGEGYLRLASCSRRLWTFIWSLFGQYAI